MIDKWQKGKEGERKKERSSLVWQGLKASY
jgi:hypothetical protein